MQPIRYLISCINSSNIFTNPLLSKCTHISVPYDIITKDGIKLQDVTFIQNLFKLKLNNRYIKTLLSINVQDIQKLGSKKILNILLDCGFDGIIFNNIFNTNSHIVYNIISILSSLSPPYNFNWEFVLQTDNKIILPISHITYIITPKNFVKAFTDLNWNPQQILVSSNKDDQDILEFVKFNKLGGIYNINELSSIYINGLQHSLNYKNLNHIEYPTSKILNPIINQHIESILDSYNNSYPEHILPIEININLL
jgi:hypothetical protein|uniref:Uncharacterized protein n=1 Tax=viral metagenome TaxID=1070528 RepID=A0A6C0DVR6_9ZZZZ